jgi:hypothetical protein
MSATTPSIKSDALLRTEYQLYQKGISLVDSESAARIKRFYHRDDSCRMPLETWCYCACNNSEATRDSHRKAAASCVTERAGHHQRCHEVRRHRR